MLPHRLVCRASGRSYDPSAITYLCEEEGPKTPPGGILRGVLEVEYDFAAKPIEPRHFADTGRQGTARYLPLLPLPSPDLLPPLQVGGTPLESGGRWGQKRGFARLWFKDEARNPTGSFKDRASVMVVAKAKQLGITRVTAASTGNAGTALAGMCAAAGMEAIVFVPESAPEGKLCQLLAYGATVVRVAGTYDDAFELCLRATEEFGWYNRNTAYNPWTIDGKRVPAFEIAEQLGWRAPDWIAVSVGDGCIISGLAKGFRDLLGARLIDKMPKLLAVQAEGSNTIVRAWRDDLPEPIVVPGAKSMAESIVVEAPRNGLLALRDIRDSDGAGVAVSEDEIRQAMRELAAETGLFVEPSCAITAAGVEKAAERGYLSRDEEIVVVLTGTGLKDVRGAMKCYKMPEPVKPKLKALKKALALE
ncbi:MAG: threonine synthase [Sumerlaeia bacterium]